MVEMLLTLEKGIWLNVAHGVLNADEKLARRGLALRNKNFPSYQDIVLLKTHILYVKSLIDSLIVEVDRAMHSKLSE